MASRPVHHNFNQRIQPHSTTPSTLSRTNPPHRNAHVQHQRTHPTHTHQPRPDPTPAVRSPLALLSHCTTGAQLTEAQLIALSDEVGSLRELVLLALCAAAGEAGCVERLVGALGERAAGGVVEFFEAEWEVE